MSEALLPIGVTAAILLWACASEKQSRARTARFFSQHPELRPGYTPPKEDER